MLYVKAQISEEVEIRVPLYGDQIYSPCPDCGKETEVDEEVLLEILKDGDLAGTAVYCESCSVNHMGNPDK
jgi:uncharacterized Zn finger protein